MKARRGTAIVETEQGILLNAIAGNVFLLPGGRATLGESYMCAAIRELHEETGLQAYYAMYLFSFQSRKNNHHVFLMQAIGLARPMSEIERIGYYRDGRITNIFDRKGIQYRDLDLTHVSDSTRDILRLYAQYKHNHAEFFHFLADYTHAAEQQYMTQPFLLGEHL
ncbi:MAG: NUDIX domain-containing protein [Bacteroidota bacterium]|nr:NUDIX domain-containing protein [Candidatus Kapabacteria bacterium]MDW8219006.1 NUDIX domain-containing protein [Bacteroidota bacterium]